MFAAVPPQVFLMYYLTDTSRENGCLRVIPGSHTRHNPLHDVLAEPHSEVLGRAESLDRAEFGRRPDEVDVPVRAGELVIGDARLLHASHPNGSDRHRTVLTLWYQPDYPLAAGAGQGADGRQDPAAGRSVVRRGQGPGPRPAPRLRRARAAAPPHAATQAIAGVQSVNDAERRNQVHQFSWSSAPRSGIAHYSAASPSR